MHSFSEFAKDDKLALDGEKIKIGEVLNAEIEVLAYRMFESKAIRGKECLQLQINHEGQLRVIFTNSEVLARQVKKYESELPFRAIIRHVGSYYCFS